MASNRGVAYIKPGEVEVRSIPYPKLKMPKSETDPFGGKDAPHGVILKIVTTNILRQARGCVVSRSDREDNGQGRASIRPAYQPQPRRRVVPHLPARWHDPHARPRRWRRRGR